MKVIGAVIFICVLAYPFFVYWSLKNLSLNLIGWSFLTILILRTLLLKQPLKNWLPLIAGVVATTVLLSVYQDPLYLKLNPVIISFCVCLTFGWTLFTPPSMIETFARLGDKNLPDEAIPYYRKVTILWVIFLFLNTLTALYTCFFTDFEVWVFYNGFLSYILMGLLFAGEFIIRKFILKKS